MALAATDVGTAVERQRGAHVPPAYVGALVRQFAQEDIDPACSAEWLWEEPIGRARSVFISGANGTGKTHLASALVGEWGGSWRTATAIVLAVQKTWRHGSDHSEEYLIEDLVTRRLLVIDDLTTIAKSERGLNTMLTIIGGRMDELRPTIVTAFQGLQAIDVVDSSLASRLGSFRQIRLIGKDRRLQ